MVAIDDGEQSFSFKRVFGSFANALGNQSLDLGVGEFEKLAEPIKLVVIENPRLVEQETLFAFQFFLAAIDDREGWFA
ncbi:hypothetical protein [Burkholderia multivorans]|uniref:hypothetical protein n=1 Tax=Burkholderia multivorans TaxID=87883 RepID=UPI001C21A704|nr:hypothetical protein [Burkholderia multivorans]MBU9211672.1 hypothetical protein [Burkholderia multivorans]